MIMFAAKEGWKEQEKILDSCTCPTKAALTIKEGKKVHAVCGKPIEKK
jgi:hypothetical protein